VTERGQEKKKGMGGGVWGKYRDRKPLRVSIFLRTSPVETEGGKHFQGRELFTDKIKSGPRNTFSVRTLRKRGQFERSRKNKKRERLAVGLRPRLGQSS